MIFKTFLTTKTKNNGPLLQALKKIKMKKNQLFKPFRFIIITAAVFISCKKNFTPEALPVPQGKTANNPKKKSDGSLVSGQNPAARAVVQNEIIHNTDYISAGVGGLRDVGNGVISLSGTSGSITKAYLYWHGVTTTSTDAGNSIIVNGTTVNGTNIGLAWGASQQYTYSQAYRADVTALVQATGNGMYSLNGFGDMNPSGASLIVFFNDGNDANNRDVEIFEGNDYNVGLNSPELYPDDPGGWEVNFTGFTYNSGSANIQMHVAEGHSGQENWDGVLRINNQELVPWGHHLFDGNSVPPSNNDGLWDIRTFNISSFLTPGLNTLTLNAGPLGVYLEYGNDYLSLIVALLDVPTVTAPPITNIEVPFDFKPNSCPNPFNVTEKGKVTAAILGKAGFDVSKIDKSTVKLNGIPATQFLVQDVASPFAGTVTDCNSCSTAGLDGIMDLKFEVSIGTLVATLGTVSNNQCIDVQLTGNLLPQFGGTSITGFDKIRIIKKK